MARVRMRFHITGGRADGSEWPHGGGELDCSDAEAADLIKGGLADAVAAPEPSAEPAAHEDTQEPAKPAQRRTAPRKTAQ